MYREALEETTAQARSVSVEVCWKQWAALGSLATPIGQKRASAIVDPEALLILSFLAWRRERRLVDLVGWWAETCSQLTSVQRFRTLAGRFPETVGTPALEAFARLAAESGDRRWNRHAGSVDPPEPRPGKGSDEPDFAEPAALWARLRAGFGVGARADVLAFLLGLRGSMARASLVSEATGYSPTAVRSAADEMATAHLIRKVAGHPNEYYAPPRPWVELLELYPPEPGLEPDQVPEPPPWRFWSGLFPFLADVITWGEEAVADPDLGERVLASRARDLLERHRSALASTGMQEPATARSRGAEFLVGFGDVVRTACEWMQASV